MSIDIGGGVRNDKQENISHFNQQGLVLTCTFEIGCKSIRPMKSHVDHCKYDPYLTRSWLSRSLSHYSVSLLCLTLIHYTLSSTIRHTTPSLLCYEPRIYKNYKFLFITSEEACVSVLNVLVDQSIVVSCMVEVLFG